MLSSVRLQSLACFTLGLLLWNAIAKSSADELPETNQAETVSVLDGARQPILWWAPEKASTKPTPYQA